MHQNTQKIGKKEREAICRAGNVSERTFFNAVNDATFNPESIRHLRVRKLVEEWHKAAAKAQESFERKAKTLGI